MRWSPGVQPPSGLLRLEESVLQANWADMTGGGVYNDRQLVALIASTLAGNSSPGRGRCIHDRTDGRGTCVERDLLRQ